MKKKELKDLKELPTVELIQKEKTCKKELFDMNYKRKLGTVEKPARFKAVRKDIARILTIIRERELKDERRNQKS